MREITSSDLEKPSGDYARDLRDGKRVLFRRGADSEARAEDADDRVLEFVASTDGVKRDGNRVRNEGWNFDNFAKNPVFLWGHDSGGGDTPPLPPIGSVIRYWVEDGPDGGTRLMIRVKFAEHELAETVYRLYQQGHLRAVSIGWAPLEYEPILDAEGAQIGWDFLRNELLEVSAVPVPSDPDALMIAAASGSLPQEQMGAFARALRTRDQGCYVLDHRALDGPGLPAEEQDREVDFDAGRQFVEALTEEVARLWEAIQAEDREKINECVKQTEAIIQAVEQMLHAVVDEVFEDDEPEIEQGPSDEEVEAARGFDEHAYETLVAVIADLGAALSMVEAAVADADPGEVAEHIGHAMRRVGQIEAVLAGVYRDYLYEADEEEEAPEEAPAEDEVMPDEEEDDLVAAIEALIERQVEAAGVTVSPEAEERALALIEDGRVNLVAGWQFDRSDAEAILGREDAPDWDLYAAAHLGRRDADEQADGYCYPVAKVQDGELVLYVAALRVARFASSRSGDAEVFEAAGRILEALRDHLEAGEAARQATVPARRVGKAISKARGSRLYEVREMADRMCRMLDEVLEEGGWDKDDEDRAGEAELLARISGLAEEFGLGDERALLDRIADLERRLAPRSTPEDLAEAILKS